MALNKQRLYWVDVAKGLLILLMAMSHMTQRGDELGITCFAIAAFKRTVPLWSTFYMATFFIISGFWSNNEMGFKACIIKNAKSLLLPLIVFSYLGGIFHELFYEILKRCYNESALVYPSQMISLGYWFVLALFIAKCIYWLVGKLTNDEKHRWSFYVLAYFLGVLLLSARFLPNYAFGKYAAVMMIYLPLGQVLFKYLRNLKLFVFALVLFCGMWFVFQQYNFAFPSTTQGMQNLDFAKAVPSLVFCVTGSFVFLRLCSLVKRNRILELLGRNTLAIYVMHWWIEILAMKVMRSLFSQGLLLSTIATMVTLTVAVFVPCFISELLTRSKLKWILGKS